MILVTGGCGFIGDHLLRTLARQRPAERLRCLDVRPPAQALPRNVELVMGEVHDPDTAARAVHSVSAVIHLAARVQPSAPDSPDLFRVNVVGTRTMLRAAVRASCAQFIHLSSAGVYGHPRYPRPFRETDELLPETPYQRSKAAAEAELRARAIGDTVVNVLRPAGVYGPGSVLEIPAYRAVRNRRVIVKLPGGVVVHPTHVRDVVAAILALLNRPAPTLATFNFGGERALLYQDLQMLVAAAMGIRPVRVSVPKTLAVPAAKVLASIRRWSRASTGRIQEFARGDQVSAAVDDTRFRHAYPEVTRYPLQSGVREHIDWAREHRLL